MAGSTVPTYDTPQVEAKPLGAPDIRSVASEEILGGGAKSAQILGQGMLSAGTGLAAVAYHMQERENADKIFRAETAVKDDLLKYEQEVRQNRQGRFAKDLTTDTQKWWDERIKVHSENLDNDAQRQIFAKRATALRQSSVETVSRWEANQMEKSHDEGWQADKNATKSYAAANPTLDNIENARSEIDRLNRYQGVRKGWEASQLQGQNLKDTTELHRDVLQELARKNPMAARAYFDKYKGEIDGRQHAEIGAFAEKVSANAVGDATADDVWKTHGPKVDTDPTNLDTMEQAIREKLKGNESATKAAIAALKERSSAFDKGTAERKAASAAAVNSAFLSGKSLRDIRGMPEYQRLDGTAQRQLQSSIEAEQFTRFSRGRAYEEARDVDQGRKNWAVFEKYHDPEALKAMSRNDVMNLAPTLGRHLTSTLLTRWDSLDKSQTKVLEARMDADDFNHVAQEIGLRPFDPTKSEDQKARLGELKYNIENLINAEQTRAKRPLNRDEKMTIMRREMDNKVLSDPWYSVFGVGTDKKPAILLTPDEQKDAYVTVGSEKVKLATIPADYRAYMMGQLQKRRVPVTEQKLAELWVADREAWGKK